MAEDIVLLTVEEANALLPRVHAALADLRAFRKRMQDVRDKQEVLDLIHGSKIAEPQNPDHAEWTALGERAGALVGEVEDYLTAIHREGILLKDLDQGLVDFYHDRDGEVVFLCWREGEDDIQFWHPIQTGFAGRQPLDMAG